MNVGVMRLVGEAVSEDLSLSSSLPVIGIATWGIVAMRDQIPVKKLNSSQLLDDIINLIQVRQILKLLK